ncbi:MAG TPA: 16S rRNA (guanine(966)-N(2))-methyltransferase RsmD [Steroidobacteraceae bacterium]|nr:16S rRNA (guanine(966)-N(2))-methyltransferase RsmD [Steroidobacteraceae bacterium]
MRIVAGRWRGRRFRFPAADIRPTPDRVRETLFNWLQPRIVGARCLDLYAGSGALGLEALSRGAASVAFVENQRLVAEALRALLHEWQATGAQVTCAEARHWLGQGVSRTERFDLVFLDPPYAASRDGELSVVLALLRQGLLASDARIYVEHAKADPEPPLAGFRQLRTGTAGEVRYHLLGESDS